jgi:hypothetical protein
MRRLKFVVGDLAVVSTKGRRDLRGRVGVVVQIGPMKGEYAVEFTDGGTPSLASMEAMMLDAIPNPAAQAATTARTQLLRADGNAV